MVQMEDLRNSSQQATGYVLVKVEDSRPQMIAIGYLTFNENKTQTDYIIDFSCVIAIMCAPNLVYQLVNPTTQVALFSMSIGNTSIIENMTWNIYSGEINSSSSANYSLIEYLPINRNLFTIDNRTGYLTILTGNLDREDLCLNQHCSCQTCQLLFQLTVEIMEKIFHKIIEIQILDRNDHSPIFDNQSMTHIIHIKENVPLGYRIVLPIATDPDEGLFEKQKC